MNVEQDIYVEVVNRDSRSEEDSLITRCETVGISMGGLRICLPVAIAAGSTINIAVPMADWQDNLELVGEALWVGEAENKERYWVGLQLENTRREDMANWFKVAHRRKK